MRAVIVLVCLCGWFPAGCGRKADSAARPEASPTNAAHGSLPNIPLVPDTLPELQAAAERGDAGAQQRLGRAYFDGGLMPPDAALALKWSRLSAEQGHAEAQLLVANCFAQGLGTPQDHGEALRWYRRAAEQGHGVALLNLGFAYSQGQGAPKDPAEAVKWFRQAAAQGVPAAQSNLGFCYATGEGVAQDFVESVQWYRRAAEQGFAEAQASLATSYYMAQGVPKDLVEAARWNRLAAEQGEARAQANLGLCHVTGEGVPPDPVEAYKWFTLAAARGYTRAVADRERLVQQFGFTSAGLAEGERRAAEFVPKPTPATAGLPAPILALKSGGSGFFITEDGFLLTSFHVVAGAARVLVKTRAGTVPATLVKADPLNDLAVLKAEGKFRALPLASSGAVKLGAAVFTIGFPNPDWQGVSPKLTKGDISTLAGMRDDPRQFQVSVATQPGNSGGPLLDERGNVVGVLAMQANEALILRATGTLPQNVNYAVKSAYAVTLLESVPELAAKLKAPHPKPRKFEDAVAEAEAAAALILVY